MSPLFTTVKLLYRVFSFAKLGSWRVAFLCGALTVMGDRRKHLKHAVEKILNEFADGNNEVALKFRVSGCDRVLLMRKNNRDDFLIAGEAVWGAYKSPEGRPSAIIDGGANIGIFSLVSTAFFEDVPLVCYEPNRDNSMQLERNLSANRIRAQVFQAALWSSNTKLFFHSHSSYAGFVSEEASNCQVDCVRLDAPDGCWLKLDIEGSEYEVVPDFLDRGMRPSFLSMEIHFNNERGRELVDLLKKSGYHISKPHDSRHSCINITAKYSGTHQKGR